MLPIRRIGPLVKLGDGDVGGKARVLPFLERLISRSQIRSRFSPHLITIPETYVLSTDCFVDFVQRNGLESCVDLHDDQEVQRRFLAGKFSDVVRDSLAKILEIHNLPLAVRSSAMSEDTHHHATAGLFSTYFIPNRGPERLRQLQEAIKLVFASAYFTDVNHYLYAHSIPREVGQMAVALETVVGTTYGNIHYPLVAGVAQSVNFFPVGKMRPEDGVATMVMGLGCRAVSGRDGMRFSPAFPLVRPYLQHADDILQVAQQYFDSVNLDAITVHLSGSESDTIKQLPITDAEPHGTLTDVASVWERESGVFYESLMHPGQRLITFNRLLRESSFPLPTMLTELLKITEDGFGSPVEIEFALDMRRNETGRFGNFVLLQARPLPELNKEVAVEFPAVTPNNTLIKTSYALGHGSTTNLKYVVFVDPEVFSLATSEAIKEEVVAFNERLRQERAHYILLGPGRWGSCNKAVGVSVAFRQIDQAQLVGEIATPRLAVEPSQGTHFFHNMVSRNLYYLTIDTRLGHEIGFEWLRRQPDVGGGKLVKLIRSEEKINICVDAHKQQGLVFLS